MPLTDPQRPQYHFLPPSGWMNDPNGLIHWQGRITPGPPMELPIHGSQLGLSLRLNREHSSLNPAPDTSLHLHLYLNHSVIELLANAGTTALTSCVYPLRSNSTGLSLFSMGGAAEVELDAWHLASIR